MCFAFSKASYKAVKTVCPGQADERWGESQHSGSVTDVEEDAPVPEGTQQVLHTSPLSRGLYEQVSETCG